MDLDSKPKRSQPDLYDVDYRKLEAEDEDMAQRRFEVGDPTTWQRLSVVAIILLIITTIALLLIVPFAGNKNAPAPMPTASLDCGNTSAEAMAKGCRIEPMMYGWVPPECFYDDLSDQYHVYTDRKWYEDRNLQHEVEPSRMLAGELPMVYTTGYHSAHCLFMWRKMARAVNHRVTLLDNKALSLHHADHCAKSISLFPEDPSAVATVKLGFYHCVRLPWA